jgi:hypothetical protein
VNMSTRYFISLLKFCIWVNASCHIFCNTDHLPGDGDVAVDGYHKYKVRFIHIVHTVFTGCYNVAQILLYYRGP